MVFFGPTSPQFSIGSGVDLVGLIRSMALGFSLSTTSSFILLFSDIKVSCSVVSTIYTWLHAWVGITSTVITLGWACMNLDYDLISILGHLSMLWHRSKYWEVKLFGHCRF